MNSVVIVDTGCANIASLAALFRRENINAVVSRDRSMIENATRLVLPGVGAFGSALTTIRNAGIENAIVEHINSGKPTLGICLGLQLLCTSSEESPGVRGLGIVDAKVKRIGNEIRVPQMGWNHAGSDWFYFANSYFVTVMPAGFDVTWSFYGEHFAASFKKGNLLACQFHPELSGEAGQRLIKNWLGLPVSHSPTTSKRVIACLDVKNGRVVKGVRFEQLRDAGDPVEQAIRYEQEGVDEICMLDISATLEERRTTVDLVRRLRETLSIPLLVGGGIRNVYDAEVLLNAGADKIAVNSAAVADPTIIQQLSERYGSQCCVVAIDGKSGRVVSRAGTERTCMDVVAWAKEAAMLGAGEILLTSIERDGTREGYDVKLIEDVSSVVTVPIIASGGAHEPTDMVHAFQNGASACLAATIFHDGVYSIAETKRILQKNNIGVRL